MEVLSLPYDFTEVNHPSTIGGQVAFEVELSITKPMWSVSPDYMSFFNYFIPSSELQAVYGSANISKLNRELNILPLGMSYSDSYAKIYSGSVNNILYAVMIRSSGALFRTYLSNLKKATTLLMYPIGMSFFSTPQSDSNYHMKSVRMIVSTKLQDSMSIVDAQKVVTDMLTSTIFSTQSITKLNSIGLHVTYGAVYAEEVVVENSITNLVDYDTVSLSSTNILRTVKGISDLAQVNSDSGSWLSIYGELLSSNELLIELAESKFGSSSEIGYEITRTNYTTNNTEYICAIKNISSVSSITAAYVDSSLGQSTEYSYTIYPEFADSSTQGAYSQAIATTKVMTAVELGNLNIPVKDEYSINLDDYKASALQGPTTKPFMFEFYTSGMAKRFNYQSFFEVSSTTANIIDAVHKVHSQLVGDVVTELTQPIATLQAKYKGDYDMALSLPTANPANSNKSYYSPWETLTLQSQDTIPCFYGEVSNGGWFAFLPTEYINDFLGGTYRAGIYTQMGEVVSKLSAKMNLKTNGWLAVKSEISDLTVIEYNGKYYVDGYRVLFAFAPANDNPMPMDITASSSTTDQYGGLITMALTLAIAEIIQQLPTLLFMGLVVLILDGISGMLKQGGKAANDLAKDFGAAATTSLLLVGGVVVIGGLILLYLLAHPESNSGSGSGSSGSGSGSSTTKQGIHIFK